MEQNPGQLVKGPGGMELSVCGVLRIALVRWERVSELDTKPVSVVGCKNVNRKGNAGVQQLLWQLMLIWRTTSVWPFQTSNRQACS